MPLSTPSGGSSIINTIGGSGPGVPNFFVRGYSTGAANDINRVFNFGQMLLGIGNSTTDVYRSDRGRIWANRPCAITLAQTFAAYDESHDTHFVCGYDAGGGPQGSVFTSNDGGENWTSRKAALALISANNVNGVGVQSGTQLTRRVIVAQDNVQNLSYTDDGGVTWGATGALDIVNRTFYVIHHAPGVNGTGLWMTFYAGQCFTSINNGNTWTNVGSCGLTTVRALIWVERFNGGNGLWIVCGNGAGIYTSVDDGVTWVQYAPTALGQNYAIHDSGTAVLVVGQNGDWTSTEDGLNWSVNTLKKFTTNTIFGVTCLHSHWIFATTADEIWTGTENDLFPVQS